MNIYDYTQKYCPKTNIKDYIHTKRDNVNNYIYGFTSLGRNVYHDNIYYIMKMESTRLYRFSIKLRDDIFFQTTICDNNIIDDSIFLIKFSVKEYENTFFKLLSCYFMKFYRKLNNIDFLVKLITSSIKKYGHESIYLSRDTVFSDIFLSSYFRSITSLDITNNSDKIISHIAELNLKLELVYHNIKCDVFKNYVLKNNLLGKLNFPINFDFTMNSKHIITEEDLLFHYEYNPTFSWIFNINNPDLDVEKIVDLTWVEIFKIVFLINKKILPKDTAFIQLSKAAEKRKVPIEIFVKNINFKLCANALAYQEYIKGCTSITGSAAKCDPSLYWNLVKSCINDPNNLSIFLRCLGKIRSGDIFDDLFSNYKIEVTNRNILEYLSFYNTSFTEENYLKYLELLLLNVCKNTFDYKKCLPYDKIKSKYYNTPKLGAQVCELFIICTELVVTNKVVLNFAKAMLYFENLERYDIDFSALYHKFFCNGISLPVCYVRYYYTDKHLIGCRLLIHQTDYKITKNITKTYFSDIVGQYNYTPSINIIFLKLKHVDGYFLQWLSEKSYTLASQRRCIKSFDFAPIHKDNVKKVSSKLYLEVIRESKNL